MPDKPPFLENFNEFQRQVDEELNFYPDSTKIVKLLWIIIHVLAYIASKLP